MPGQFAELLEGINANFMFVFAAPNWQRRSPKAVPREGPVDVVIEPVAIATFLNSFRVPICFCVLAK